MMPSRYRLSAETVYESTLLGFSKKVANHAYAVALHFLHYNFARVHKTLRITPAMEAGLANHVWSIEEIVGLLDRTSAIAA